MASLNRIPNVTVYKREEMPKRFHYSKPEHRLGEIIALPNNEGHILSEVSESPFCRSSVTASSVNFPPRQPRIQPTQTSATTGGITHWPRCKQYSWPVVRTSTKMFNFTR